MNRNFFRRRFYDHIRQHHSDLLDGKYMVVMSFKKGTLFSSKEEASIALFDKAAYTPTLLYLTGASFEKLGKTKEAQGFYKALKENYPDSPEAKKVK